MARSTIGPAPCSLCPVPAGEMPRRGHFIRQDMGMGSRVWEGLHIVKIQAFRNQGSHPRPLPLHLPTSTEKSPPNPSSSQLRGHREEAGLRPPGRGHTEEGPAILPRRGWASPGPAPPSPDPDARGTCAPEAFSVLTLRSPGSQGQTQPEGPEGSTQGALR